MIFHLQLLHEEGDLLQIMIPLKSTTRTKMSKESLTNHGKIALMIF